MCADLDLRREGLENILGECNDDPTTSESKIFTLTSKWRSNFAKGWNLTYRSRTTTCYTLEGVLSQLAPSLEWCYVLRMLYDIPIGEGRIMNADQTMHYCCYQPDNMASKIKQQ